MTGTDNVYVGATVKSFQRKRNDIEAARLTRENARELAKWCGGEVIARDESYVESYTAGFSRTVATDSTLHIPSLLDGPTPAYVGDWIVKDEDGRFSVILNEVFVDEYELKRPPRPDVYPLNERSVE